MAFNKGQWIESFEGQLAVLCPHLTLRVLTTMSLSAWHSRGSKGEDPIKAAKEESKALESRTKKGQP